MLILSKKWMYQDVFETLDKALGRQVPSAVIKSMFEHDRYSDPQESENSSEAEQVIAKSKHSQ